MLTVCPRMSVLHAAGSIAPSSERRINRISGMTARVWRATTDGGADI